MAKQSKASTRKPSPIKATHPKAKGSHALPIGFKVVGQAPPWDFEKIPVIQGERGKTKEATIEGKVRRNFVIHTEEHGSMTVWESALLSELFDETEKGDIVHIEFLGYQKPKHKGHNPTKLFSVAYKE